MFPGAQALQRERRVEFVRNDDADGVQIRRSGEHFLHGGEDTRDAPFLRGLLRRSRRGIRHRDDLRPGLAESLRMVFHHPTGSDDSYFQ